MVIHIIRHTKPAVPEETFYGQTDVDVIQFDFIKQSQIIKSQLPLEETELIISSPLQRCLKLAEMLQTKQTIQTDSRIKELNFGDWEMVKWNSIEANQMKKWTENFTNEPAPNGESHRLLFNRSVEFFQELINKPLSSAIVVTHAGVIRSLLAFMLEIPLEKSFSIKLHYGELIRIEHIQNNHYNIEFLKH